MYRVIEAGKDEFTKFFDQDKNSQSELFQVIQKHRRFLLNCATREDFEELPQGWHFKSDRPAVVHRVYESQTRLDVREDAGRNIIRWLSSTPEKEHDTLIITPGTHVLVFFLRAAKGGPQKCFENVHAALRDVFARWGAVTFDGNDVLICDRKAGGIDINHSERDERLIVTAILNYDGANLRRYESLFDFSKHKYRGFAGVNETGMSEDEFDLICENFYGALVWL